MIIDLEVTSVCNAACPFCPRDALNRSARFIDPQTVRRLAERLRGQAAPVQVSICGIGEPTLYPDLAGAIATLHDAGARVCLVTNGSNLDPGQLAHFHRAGLAEVNVSLNAASAATRRRLMQLDDFAATTQALGEALAQRDAHFPGLELNVSFVLCEDNADELLAFVRRWQATPVGRIRIHPLNNRANLLGKPRLAAYRARALESVGQEPKVEIDIFAGIPGDGRMCKILYLIDFISVDGEMLLCGMDYRRRFSFGNVRDHSLEELRRRKIHAFTSRESQVLCATCDYAP